MSDFVEGRLLFIERQSQPLEEPMSTTATHHAPFHERHDDELLTLSEVAEILMTSDNTVRWWRQIGSGPVFFKIGRRLYTTVGELRRFIREQRLASRPVLPSPRRS
jgi:hypothetical protein